MGNGGNVFIELMSICRLKECLLHTKRVVPVINDTDKEPIWDGHLYLYKEENEIKNQNLLGRIPIQVKGTCRGNTKRNKFSYGIDIGDLKQYRKNGGTIFFVVVMGKNMKDYSIFYNRLLPFDLVKILNNSKESGKINVQVSKFPAEDKKQIFSILKGYIDHSQKQTSTAERGLQISEALSRGESLDDLNIESINVKTSNEIFGDINKLDTAYVYAVQKGGIEIPIQMVQIQSVFTEIKRKVVIGEEIFENCHVKLTNASDGEHICIENSLTVFKPRQSDVLPTLKFKISENLDEAIIALKMIQALNKYNTLAIEGAMLGKCSHFNSIDMGEINKRLEYYEKTKRALSILHYNKPFNIGKLSKEEVYTLSEVVVSVTDNMAILNRFIPDSKIGKLHISDYTFLLQIEKTNNGKCYIKPLSLSNTIGYIEFEQEDKYPVSIYIILKRNDFCEIDNLSYDDIYESIIKSGYYPQTEEKINLLMLEMLAAYDISDDSELLRLAERIADWLIENNDLDIYIINKCQCIYRFRPLNDEETEKLIQIKENTDIQTIKFGVNVLLNNAKEAKYMWGQLEKDEIELMKKMPIYKLFKEMKNS
ncbi:MAG: DUF4365 domain-containing protein [Clostridia bacterium]|nr:DUF4365 domain-containing protein [Clostridia bacterium]